MPDTITVASRLEMDIRMEVDGKPRVVIHGSNSREAVNGAGITHGVDAEAFKTWMEMHGKSDMVREKLIQKVDPAKLEEAKKDLPAPPPVPVTAAPAPAPTERADVADLKVMKEAKVAPATPPAAPPT
jgi:hypothetical protein